MAETKTATPKLNKDVFNVEVKNHELLKLAYDSYLAAARGADATTLQRGEVRGGGRKPWRQKGTGRARFGSSRNPIWRGGGVVFGPRGNENYTKNISKTSKKVAVRQALSLANADKKIIVIDSFKTTGKTKEAVAILDKNKVTDKDAVLLVVAEKTDQLIRATSNINNLYVLRSCYLNVFDILNSDKILITAEALPQIEAWLIGEEK
ncbi:MAG: 50S ribosomal protein L4 [Candidatus Nomurabacteria bacterium]|jgi:large subunit ribosomal protein L4|nr:50S ribosomal protein L4 [Candidatus Nomurabacteria bacterium]